MTRLPTEKAQRLRVRFARRAEAGSVGHLEMARCWAHALDAASIAVSHTEGHRQQPRLTIAAGLPVGVTSEGELFDVILAQHLHPAELAARVHDHLPPGLDVLDVREVGVGLPALPTSVRWADYSVDLPTTTDARAAVEALLAADTLRWEDTRGKKVRRYDLRPLVQDITVERCADVTRLIMRLRCDASGVGRADQVAKALCLPEPLRVHRLRLVLSEPSPARDAWRRRGRFA
ncbi:MAG: TIGR03936 family radical SAM-associated protein [Conexibacter sp.]